MKTFINDGNQTFHNYYWNQKGCIFNTKTNRIIKPPKEKNKLKEIGLTNDQGEVKYRSFNKLKKFSYIKKHLPQNYNMFVDVYGWENLYCFDPNDPTRVWSKTKLKFKKIQKNPDGYKFFRAGKGSIYIHTMVMQAHYQMKIDPDKYEIHHKHGLENNMFEDLILLTKEQHRSLHKEQRALKKLQEKEFGNE